MPKILSLKTVDPHVKAVRVRTIVYQRAAHNKWHGSNFNSVARAKAYIKEWVDGPKGGHASVVLAADGVQP